MRKAFTLLELLLVLALILAISSLGVASFQRQYARSQFKSGVVEVQVDINKTRLLAMKSGQAYVFRFVPGSSVYEIAPLRTLQEAIYRINGEDEEEEAYSPLGGSLAAAPNSAFDLQAPEYDDDLFSPANVLADMREAMRLAGGRSRLGATSVDMTAPLGGSLAALPNASSDDPFASQPFDYVSGDAIGSGAQFAVDPSATSSLGAEIPPTTLREMNVDERSIGKSPNTLAWRVNADGLVARKQAPGGVIFSFERISESTPTQLRAKRPGGTTGEVATGAALEARGEGEDFGSRLGGSLTSIPSGESSAALGGGLNATPNDETANPFEVESEETSNLPHSLWSEPIVFYPNGKTSTVAVALACDGKYPYYSEIALRGATGYARISAISSEPIGLADNRSALTQEQLFRLTNPQPLESTADASALGGALVSSGGTTGGALGAAIDGDSALSASALGELDPATATSGANFGATTNYGSNERRSNYRFDAAPTSSADWSAVDAATTANGVGAANASLGATATSATSANAGLGYDGSATSDISTPAVANGGFPSTSSRAASSADERETTQGGGLQ